MSNFSKIFSRKKTDTSVHQLYEILEDARVSNNRNLNYEWLNLGYWKNADTIDFACREMLDLVMEKAALKNREHILDVGFGYGIQDIYIAQIFHGICITGINIFDKQVQYAQKKILENNLSDRVKLLSGDAVQLKFQADFFDKIIAVECAFHFNSRERFFNEAFRVLKKGGSLILTDALPKSNDTNNPSVLTASKFMGVPSQNLYSIDVYVDKLKKAGFKNVEAEEISEDVLPYGYLFSENFNEWRHSDTIQKNEIKNMDELREKMYLKTGMYHYYLISAQK